ncbi:proline-rich receptor-like protein kinase PERK1 [Esox lucius]|uniref:proline-rich receptor-like protein kinase PERK1 n=1 Tax=Esox lucius TaxID=8010 RepID=UPI0014776008|nr:proline-rich receptor-like protein kinase PERK1 [Esox lucius]
MKTMQVSQITRGTPLQIPPQPVPKTRRSILPDTTQPLQRDTVTSGDGSRQTCGSPGPGQTCWSLDVKVAVLLVTVAGVLILILLYRLLQLRHRLRLAQARHALEYYGFYHAANYTLKDPRLPQTPRANGDAAKPVVPVVVTPLPTPPVPPPVPPPPPLRLPSPPAPRQPPHLALPPPLPPPPSATLYFYFPPLVRAHHPYHPTEPSPVLGRQLRCRGVFPDWSLPTI